MRRVAARAKTSAERIDPDAKQDAPKGPTMTAVEAIIAQLEKRGPEVKKFVVSVGEGLALWFRYPKNGDELKAMQTAGLKFVSELMDEKGKLKQPLHIKEALEFAGEIGVTDLINAFCVAYWSVEPQKITQAQAIKFARNPAMLEALVFQIDQEHAAGLDTINLGGVLEKKEPSKQASDENAP